MRYLIFILIFLFFGLIFLTQPIFAVNGQPQGTDMEVLPSPISCFGGSLSFPNSTGNFTKCRWFRTIHNIGPNTTLIFSVTDSFYPASANAVGPSFQGPTLGSCYPGDCPSGSSTTSLYETFLKVGEPIDHVLRIETYGDPDCSNNTYVESFTISPSGGGNSRHFNQ